MRSHPSTINAIQYIDNGARRIKMRNHELRSVCVTYLLYIYLNSSHAFVDFMFALAGHFLQLGNFMAGGTVK